MKSDTAEICTQNHALQHRQRKSVLFSCSQTLSIPQQIDDVNRVTRENLTGLRVIRAFNAEEYQEKKFEKANSSLMKTQLFTQRSMALMMPIMTLVQSGLTLMIY